MALNANNTVKAPKVEPVEIPAPPKDKSFIKAKNIVVVNKKPLKPKYVTPEAGALTPVKKKLDRRPSKYMIDMMTP